MKRPSTNPPRSLLGLALAGDQQLAVCHLTRTNGSASVVKAATLPLPAGFLHGDAPAAGRTLRDALTAAGFREHRCAVAFPTAWLMSHQTQAPDLAPDDLASFLQLEAEKAFPIDPALLQLAASTCRTEDATYVTQLAARKEQLDRLTSVLTSAGLKPLSFAPGLALLPGVLPAAPAARLTVTLEPSGATFLISAGGGIAALRNVEADDSLPRELRITLGQLPAPLRSGLRQLHLDGDEALLRPFEASLAAATGLPVAPRSTPARPLPEQIAEHAARRLLESTPGAPALEFLPPRPSRLALLLARYDSKRLTLAAAGLATAALFTLGAFGWLEYRRFSLRSEWAALNAQSADLAAIQSLIRDYRPWYDSSFRSLGILRRVTENFPDNGSVTAKTFELRGPAAVSLSGTARDNPALLQTLDQLRKAPEIQDLKVDQIRGKAPLQFTLTFRWRDTSGS